MKKINYTIFLLAISVQLFALDWGTNPPNPYEEEGIARDTFPIIDRDSDFITDENYNPFDIMPSFLEQEVEYDPISNRYIVYEKLGDEYYKSPTYLTFDEYADWKAKQEEKKYFDKLAGLDSGYKSGSGKVDPMSKIDLGETLVDRLFGGKSVEIDPQGTVGITLGAAYQNNKNPNAPLQAQRNIVPEFDMDIQVNVDGNIGDKLNLGFNFDSQATFDFDQKMKLEYDSEQFSEDDIIKKIEAGTVSLPLRSSLIQGAQSLFGIKTVVQFGHLRLTGLLSQSRSKNDCIDIQNGSVEEEFQIRPDEYDENRHFFISHYHRNAYEDALSNLPYIQNNFRVTDIQVWISEDRPDYQQNSRMIAAVSDIAEPNEDLYSNPNANYGRGIVLTDNDNMPLPDNNVNGLFDDIVENDDENEIDKVRGFLTSKGLKQTRDFEVYRGRLLNPNEYTFNPELGFVSLNVRLQPNQVMGVSYRYFYSTVCDPNEENTGETPVFKVGSPSQEFSESSLRENPAIQDSVVPTAETVLYVKMLKSSNQRVSDPSWDLMMKNVYALRTSQLSQEDFKFDIFYEDDFEDKNGSSFNSGSLKKFLPDDDVEKIPLLNVFNLDQLNSTNDPQPDGIFDFVPGITVIPRNGSIIFPVLEPFGSSLKELVGNPDVSEKYEFQELYDSTVFVAREFLHKNKFIMAGEYKSDFASDISLGTWNIPRGSVNVQAGGRRLTEGVDYEIDYGIGRVRILDPTFLQQGVPLKVCYENRQLFSLQQKAMMGLRADYEVNEHLQLGATYLRLSERPFTEKVNVGEDPINNRVFGLDLDYSKQANWVTKAVDKLPFYSTKEPSNINFTAEVAALKPGHSKVINGSSDSLKNSGGIVSIDDFEGAVAGLPLGSQTNAWVLASTPQFLGKDGIRPKIVPEANLSENSLAYGANRAHLGWYVIDRESRTNTGDNEDPYTRTISQRELFNRTIAAGQLPDLFTFDLNYIPDERGPYNFELPDGYMVTDSNGVTSRVSAGATVENDVIKLKEPETRWGGIMRYFNNNDFQAANYEFIDFWMLNPFMETSMVSGHEDDEEGYIYFQLGNVSEDILKDELQFYENSVPTDPNEVVPLSNSVWGEIPLSIPLNNGFSLENTQAQDLGYDGLDDGGERVQFQSFIDEYTGVQSIEEDPCNDNFSYYNDDTKFSRNDPLLTRYRDFNNPQGNTPDGTSNVRGNPFPDKEDLNNNKALDQGESYWEYGVKIKKRLGANEIDTDQDPTVPYYITDTMVVEETGEKWYRFRIPLNEGEAVNGIEGFRSIQFIRMITTGFTTQKVFRLGEFELVRNQWRKLPRNCVNDPMDQVLEFSIDAVGVEENADKNPFGYTEPPGIVQEELFSTYGNILQDEKAMSLKFCNLGNTCGVSIFKLSELDLRVFKRMQLFVHAELNETRGSPLVDDDLSVFMRIGKDFEENYYEYEIPLKLTENADFPEYKNEVWHPDNMFDFQLRLLTELKKLKLSNAIPDEDERGALVISDANKDLLPPEVTLPDGHKIKIRGNPSLGYVKGIEIGVRNRSEENGALKNNACGEIWINELRMTGLEERGGVAGLTRLDVQMADLGNVAASASFSTIGWGALDQKLDQRQKKDIVDFDVSTNLELGNFLPSKWNVKVPFYAQYAKTIENEQFDSYALDLTIDEVVESVGEEFRDEVRERSQDVTTIKTFNFVNVRKEKGSGAPKKAIDKTSKRADDKTSKTVKLSGEQNPATIQKKKERKPMPWDIYNFSTSYSYTETNHRDPILKSENTKDYRVGLDYNYSRKAGYIQPFKKLKAKPLKFIKEINFNPIPNSFSFNTEVNRFIASRQFRLPETPLFLFDDRRFDWERRYGLDWNLTKGLKFDFTAINTSYIDELRQTGIRENADDREWIDEYGAVQNDADATVAKKYWQDNLRKGGRNKNYYHKFGFNYKVPFKAVQILDWISSTATYNAEYAWDAGPLITIDDEGNEPGSVISNKQNRSFNTTFNFDKFYNKSKYLKKIGQKKSSSSSQRSSRTSSNDKDKTPASAGSRKDKKKSSGPSVAEKILIRPLLMLRTIKFNYKETFGTIVPGFTGTPQFFGMGSGWSEPGFGFVAGSQPDIGKYDINGNVRRDNWLYSIDHMISESSALNQQVIQNNSKTFELNVDLEPFKDFKIDVDFKKQYSLDHTEEFKKKQSTDEQFSQLALLDRGSFNVTWMSLKTLFGTDPFELFDDFERNRRVISERQQVAQGAPAAAHDENVGYQRGFGEQSADVMVPAFLATYTGISLDDVFLDLESEVRQNSFIPKPNWKIRYDGLGKMDMFKKIFKSFRIDHGYKSSLTVSQFNSDVEYIRDFDFRWNETNLNASQNYYSRLVYPNVVIDESFAPLLGFDIKTRSDILLNFEYKKSRTLGLQLTSSKLDESQNYEYVFGAGFTMKNVVLFGGNKKKRTRQRGSRSRTSSRLDSADDRGSDDTSRGRGVSSSRGSDLIFKFDMSIADRFDKTHQIDGPAFRDDIRGERSVRISPSLEYELNQSISLRAFVDYNNRKPKSTTVGYESTNIEGGIQVQLKLNEQ